MSVDETQAPQTPDPAAADTSEEVDTSEASTQLNEAPEATQATEDTQTAEIKAEDTADEKLYAGKYKTPEEMEQAYKNLESKFGQTTSEKAELARILNSAFEAPEQSQAAPEANNDFLEESNPVNQDIEKLKVQTAVQSFIMTHQDADSNAMDKVLKEDPLVQQISGHEAKLEYAYLRSQNMAKPKAIAEAEKKSAEATEAKVIEKQAAQVESAKKADSTDESSELYERATGNYSQADRDKARRELIRKNLVNL